MTIERNRITGAWMVSDIIGDRYVHETYYGYTKREAIAIFRDRYGE